MTRAAHHRTHTRSTACSHWGVGNSRNPPDSRTRQPADHWRPHGPSSAEPHTCLHQKQQYSISRGSLGDAASILDYREWRMASSGMLCRVVLVRTDVSEELSASFIRVKRIGELRTTLAVISNRRTLRRNTTLRLTFPVHWFLSHWWRVR
jgi:hypothetical protein